MEADHDAPDTISADVARNSSGRARSDHNSRRFWLPRSDASGWQIVWTRLVVSAISSGNPAVDVVAVSPVPASGIGHVGVSFGSRRHCSPDSATVSA